MYCDTDYVAQAATISCGNAGECYYYCNAKECNDNDGRNNPGMIDARNANNFYLIIQENADQCTKDSIVLLPNNGNAYISTEGSPTRAMRLLNIQSGTNTGNIQITLNAGANSIRAMEQMTINATSAESLYIKINGNAHISAS